jgi:hypothetical protein
MNKRIKKKLQRKENKRLCERYPFLIPRSWWTDEVLWENKNSWYYCHPYCITELDRGFPKGWYKAFGKDFLEELRAVLIKGDYLDKYRVVQIKEKYGSLRWYDNGVPAGIYDEVLDIISKYEELSERTCICCGRPATKISRGWISPYCDNCAMELPMTKFKDIEG